MSIASTSPSVAIPAGTSAQSNTATASTPSSGAPHLIDVTSTPGVTTVMPAVQTLPSSQPSTPFASEETRPRQPSPHAVSRIKPLTRPKTSTHLSHVSIATWIGVCLAFAGLIVAVYYGVPMMRLAVWTAENDFREACKSDSEAALSFPQTKACRHVLENPPQQPPVTRFTAVFFRGFETSWDIISIYFHALAQLSLGVQTQGESEER
jgi:hypothetical protein